jgi:hypothetical protein
MSAAFGHEIGVRVVEACGNENRGDHLVNAGDLHQESVLRAVGLEPLRYARVECLNVVLSCFEPVKLDR